MTKALLRSALLTVALALVGAAAQAQSATFWNVRQEFVDYSLDAISVLPGDVALATGSQVSGDLTINAVLRSDDAGRSWRAIDFPQDAAQVVDGDFRSLDVGAVITEDYEVFRIADGGDSWASTTVPLTGEATQVRFFSDEHVVVTGADDRGYGAQVAVSYDGGISWGDRSFGDSTYALGSVFFLDSLTGWVGGSHRRGLEPVIYATDDAGATWREQRLPDTDGEFASVNGIYFTDALNGRAVLTSLYHVGYTYVTADGGATWTEDYNTGMPYNELAMQPNGNLAILSSSLTPARANLYVSRDAGSTWLTQRLDVNTYSRALDYVGDRILVGQNYSSIVVSDDGGVTVTQAQYAATVEDMLWVDSLTAHAVSGYVNGGPPRTLTTTDGGDTWATNDAIPGGRSIQRIGDTLWTFFPGRSAYVQRSTDGGATWRRFPLRSSDFMENAVMIDHEFGLAHGAQGTLQFTTDGGNSWRLIGSGTTAYLDELALAGDRVVIGGGFGGGSGVIRYSDNNGLTWTTAPLPNDNMILGLDFGSDLVGVASTYDGPVLRTDDGGATWTEVGFVPHEQPQTVLMVDEQRGYIVARDRSGGGAELTGQGYVYETLDGGLNWDRVYERDIPNSSLSGLAVQPNADGTVWATGQHTFIARGSGDPTSTREAAALAPELTLWPNPAPGGRTHVEFTLRTSGEVHLEIVDALGRVAHRAHLGSLPSGPHRVSLSAKLPAGTYAAAVRARGATRSALLVVR